MDHLTEQDAGLLEQGASMLEEHAEEQRTRGNCSAAEGAACSAHAIRRLAPAMLRAGRGCLAQIEEPAQPVAEICSASHDDAEFGERAIKPLRDISGFEYGTPLYAGAAPAAVACPSEALAKLRHLYLNMSSGSVRDKSSAKRIAEGLLAPAIAALEAAPALEAPAAPAGEGSLPSGFDARRTLQFIHDTFKKDLDAGYRTKDKEFAVSIAAPALAAAPQAPAAPSIAVVTDEQIDSILDSPGSLGMVIADKRERMRMFARRVLDLAAPAAPADPMDWPLPCDVTVGHGTIRKGCKLRTLVLRMQVLYNLAQEAELAAPAAPAVDAVPLDVCTDPYNCARCKTHPAHRGDMHHAGISQPRSAAQAKEGGAA